ncbi:MAG: TRAM domain-containing protein [Haloferacaceae archaeon]|jgi:predicted RNA-binding protein with TRAM domain|nr:TRAM domain-containing protein [Haloferacaceae archaeon]
MPECPLADDCPRYSERIDGMGCQYYGDRGGAEWCNSYSQPIRDLKGQPVKPGEEVAVVVDDIHESGAGVGRTEDGFIILIDGLLPDAKAIVRIDRVKPNHATSKRVVERLPLDDEEDTEGTAAEAETVDADETEEEDEGRRRRPKRPTALGSRDNFWGS